MDIPALLLALLLSTISGLRAQNKSANYPQNTAQFPSQAACPWFTQGSAAKTLGGDVSAIVKVSNTGEGSCKFARLRESANSLEIIVSKANLSGCPQDGVRLTGIGNEATRCKLRESVERVSGHVREMNFTVTLSMHGEKSPAKPLEYSADTLQQISEQVAGNLF
jgi:hypothetical protein